jgi:hypothetical protein
VNVFFRFFKTSGKAFVFACCTCLRHYNELKKSHAHAPQAAGDT